MPNAKCKISVSISVLESPVQRELRPAEGRARACEWSVDEFLRLKPNQTVGGPGMGMGKRRLVGQTHAVTAFLVDVQREGDVVFSERRREEHAVFHRHGSVLESGPDETRGGVGCDLEFVGKKLHEFGRGIGAEHAPF